MFIAVFFSLLIIGNVFSGWQGTTKKVVTIFWFSLLAVGIILYEALTSQIPWWNAIVYMGMAYLAAGPRSYAVFSQPYRNLRIYFFLCQDLPITILYFFVIQPLLPNYWSAPVFILAYSLWMVVIYFAGPILFPIVAKQELRNLFALVKNSTKVKELDDEIEKLEYQALLTKTLKRFEKQQQLIYEAGQAFTHNNPNLALSNLTIVIAELEAIQTDLTRAQKTMLGQAYIARAKVQCDLGKYNLADSDLNKSYRYIQIDEDSLGDLIEAFIDGEYFGNSLFNHSIRYISNQRGTQPGALEKKILVMLQTQLMVKPGNTEKKYREVIANANLLIQADQDFWWVHSSLGQAAYFLGDNRAAISALETSVRAYKKDPKTWAFLGKCYQKEDRLKDAQKAYEISLSLDEKQPEIAHDLGLLQLDAAKSADDDGSKAAFHWFELAVKLSPSIALYQYDLARASLFVGNKSLAKEAVLKALAIDEKMLPAHNLAGYLFYIEENWSDALPHLTRLNGSNLYNNKIKLRLGRCHAENSQWDDAIQLLEPLKEQDNQARYPLGRAYLGKLDFNRALDNLRKAVSSDQGYLPAWYALGCTLAWQSKTEKPESIDEAQQCFERVIEGQHSLMPRAQLQLGHIAILKQNPEQAIVRYEQAYTSGKLSKEAGLALIKAYLTQGQSEKAYQLLKTLENSIKGDPEANFIYGMVAEIQKDYPKAIQAYQVAKAHGHLGVVLFWSGKFEDARNELTIALSNGDRSNRVLYYSGLSHSGRGEYYEAIREWQELLTRQGKDTQLEQNITEAWYMAGCIEFRKQDYVKTAAAWEEFYKVHPTDTEIQNKLQSLYLKIAYEKIGEPESAKALIRAQQLGAPAETTLYAEGLTALKKKNWNAAADCFRKLLVETQTNPIYMYNLGLSLFFGKIYDEAEIYLKQAYENSDGSLHEQSAMSLAAIAARSEDWDRVATLTGVAD